MARGRLLAASIAVALLATASAMAAKVDEPVNADGSTALQVAA